MQLTDFLKFVLKIQIIIYIQKKYKFMDPNNRYIIWIPLEDRENSNNSLSNSEKSEKQINVGTTDSNISTNKNEETKKLEEGNDKVQKFKEMSYGKSNNEEEKGEKSKRDIIIINNLEERKKENLKQYK